MFFPGLYSKLNYLDWTNWTSFDPHLIYAFLGEDKFICVLCFEIIGEYSAAACTRSGTFLEQVITTTEQVVLSCFWPRTDKELNADLVEKKGHKSRLKLEMSANVPLHNVLFVQFFPWIYFSQLVQSGGKYIHILPMGQVYKGWNGLCAMCQMIRPQKGRSLSNERSAHNWFYIQNKR